MTGTRTEAEQERHRAKCAAISARNVERRKTRCIAAEARTMAYHALSDSEKLALIASRPGFSAKERKRITERIANPPKPEAPKPPPTGKPLTKREKREARKRKESHR